jgi:hypothetical protein
MFSRVLFKTRTYFNDPPVVPPVPPPPPPPAKTFTQEEVNALLAENKKSLQKQNQELVNQLETLKTNTKLTTEEKQALQDRIDALSTQHMTEQQKLQAALDKTSKESKVQVEALTTESKKWQGEYQRLLVTQGIIAGAVEHKAADRTGEQLAAMLLPRAKVVEKLDDSGQPTGIFEAKLPVTVIDPKTKKPVVVELPIVEAIGKMREDPKNSNLFLIDGKPGFGGTNGGSGGNGTGKPAFDPKMSPSDYRKNRAEIIGG